MVMEILGENVNLNDYVKVCTHDADVYFPKNQDQLVIWYQKKYVGKNSWHAGDYGVTIPRGLFDSQPWPEFEISPKGNLVTKYFGFWTIVKGITSERLKTAKELTLYLKYDYRLQKPYVYVEEDVRARES